MNGGTRWRSVRLGENCRVDGYVVVRGNTEQPQSPYAHYHQPSSAVVRGLVYVDGLPMCGELSREVCMPENFVILLPKDIMLICFTTYRSAVLLARCIRF